MNWFTKMYWFRCIDARYVDVRCIDVRCIDVRCIDVICIDVRRIDARRIDVLNVLMFTDDLDGLNASYHIEKSEIELKHGIVFV